MDRHWFLTWTTYGNWLPGDARGFVSNVSGPTGKGVRHNAVGLPPAADIPALRTFAAAALVSEPVRLTSPQARSVMEQFHETATYRGWGLEAVAIMANHIHVVVGVEGDPEPGDVLGDFKSYASRRLNREFGRRPRWWTEDGSKRKLADEAAVREKVEYVRRQDFPLLIWVADHWTEVMPGGGRERTVEGGGREATVQQPTAA
jgi:REP element-mobilizing transposase RayT